MLVLTRKVGERIFINGGEIIITLIYKDRDKIRLGIDAPSDMEIDREEVFKKKQEEREAEARRKQLMGISDEGNEGQTEAEETQAGQGKEPYEG